MRGRCGGLRNEGEQADTPEAPTRWYQRGPAWWAERASRHEPGVSRQMKQHRKRCGHENGPGTSPSSGLRFSGMLGHVPQAKWVERGNQPLGHLRGPCWGPVLCAQLTGDGQRPPSGKGSCVLSTASPARAGQTDGQGGRGKSS